MNAQSPPPGGARMSQKQVQQQIGGGIRELRREEAYPASRAGGGKQGGNDPGLSLQGCGGSPTQLGWHMQGLQGIRPRGAGTEFCGARSIMHEAVSDDG